jgi:hypothetical protein
MRLSFQVIEEGVELLLGFESTLVRTFAPLFLPKFLRVGMIITTVPFLDLLPIGLLIIPHLFAMLLWIGRTLAPLLLPTLL